MLIPALAGCGRSHPKESEKAPPDIIVGAPVMRAITETEEFTGHTESVKTIVIRARVSGYLEKVLFQEGAEVREGDQLFEIDRRTYQADYDRAVANLAQARAHLAHMEANYKRAKNLFATRGAISQADYDQAVSDRDESDAAVKVADAALHTAELNLNWTRVTAPISGRISRQMIDPGNLVKADDTALTTIVALDPMYAFFDIDERVMQRLVRTGKLKAAADGKAKVLLGLADEKGFPHAGTINFIDNQVDMPTGTLRLRGLFPNPDRILSPGMFVRILVPVDDPRPSLLVSEQALGSDQGMKYLYVVNDEDEVVRRDVEVGSLNDGLRVIRSGLKQGERVVLSGLQRMRPGMKVTAKEMAMAAKDSPAATGAGAEAQAISPGATPAVAKGANGTSPALRESRLPSASPKPAEESRPGVKSAATSQVRRAI